MTNDDSAVFKTATCFCSRNNRKSNRFVRCAVKVLTHAACAGSVCVVFCVPGGAELVPPSALITAASVFA